VNYTLYRYNHPITVINASASLVTVLNGTIYQETGMNQGTYYYAVVVMDIYDHTALSNCQSVLVRFPGQIIINSPDNATIYGSIYGLPLQFTLVNMPNPQAFWYWVNSTGSWTNIASNTTFDVLHPGTHQLRVRALDEYGMNVTSDPVTFSVIVNNTTGAEIQIGMSTAATSFTKGQTITIDVQVNNTGTVLFYKFSIYFSNLTGDYFVVGDPTYRGINFAPGDQIEFSITVTLSNDTVLTPETIRGWFTAESYSLEFAVPLNPAVSGPDSTLMIIIITGSAIGGTVVMIILVKYIKKKRALDEFKNRGPKPGENSAEGWSSPPSSPSKPDGNASNGWGNFKF
jgi:hypothetical protein